MDEETQQQLPMEHVFEVHVPAGVPWQELKGFIHDVIELWRKEPHLNVLMLDLPAGITEDELAWAYQSLRVIRAQCRTRVAERKASGG